MKVSEKIKVGIIYGGRSCEHDVSLKSATSIIKNLDKNIFEIIPIGIDKEGIWFVNDYTEFTLDETIPIKTKSSRRLSALEELNQICEVLFPVIHGKLGEDGSIQGLFKILNLPYVGADVLGSAIGMDKVMARRLVFAYDILVPSYVTFNSGQWHHNTDLQLEKIKERLHFPVFVKPCSAGSSLGITKVKEAKFLTEAIHHAFSFDTKIVIEQALEVREVEIAVLENLSFGEDPLVSTLGEIIPNHEFYSYEAKYIDKEGALLIIPAVLQKQQLEEIKYLAMKIFKFLACEGLARVDFFIEKITQKIYFNEINTIPGFTDISMYPKLWEASGCDYQQLLTHLIELARLRHRRWSQLII